MERFDVAVVGMGALGSAAAYHLARKGVNVVAFEQFELGHVRGASHDTSRIIRTSYGNPHYVRLAKSAYQDWADFEAVAGERFVTVTDGLVFCPGRGALRRRRLPSEPRRGRAAVRVPRPGGGDRPLAAVPHPRERGGAGTSGRGRSSSPLTPGPTGCSTRSTPPSRW
ncbi:MAG: FAD-dependent oxidoreductase [Pseudonocardia sp.]